MGQIPAEISPNPGSLLSGNQHSGSRVVRKAVSERAEAAESEADEIRQRWVEAELIYVDQEERLRSLEVRCAALEQENALLKASIAGENVVAIAACKG